MKNLAKVLALVLAMTMVMSTMVFAANPFADVADDATYAEAVTMLSDLNILSGYDEEGVFYFKPDQTITRAEVAKVIVCALGATDAAAGAANLNTFTDVDATHWAAGYVNYIAGYNNIIAGYGNGTFGPSDPVLYEQTIKMIVCALGYYPMAMQRGGYPTGFLAVASELGLTKGATGSAGEPAKRWVVARILYNALTVAMMKQTGWDINNPEYTITGTGDYEEETLLEDYLDVVKVNGLVTSTFYQDSPVDKENLKVTISGLNEDDAEAVEATNGVLTIDVGNTEAEQYHGYAVTAYVYTDEDGEQVLVAIAPRGTRNTAVTISLSDIVEVKDGSKNTVSVIYENEEGKDVTIKVDEEATVYKNMDLVEGIEDYVAYYDALMEETGSVTFIQNETSDQYADYVFVEAFDGASRVITKIDADKARIEYEYMNGGTYVRSDKETLDAEDEETWITFIKDGKEIAFEDLAEGDVYTKIVDNDKDVIKVYVASETIEGKISSVSVKENSQTVTIAGTKYDFENVAFTRDDIGAAGTFYMNVNGKIVFFDETEGSASNDDFAYLYAVASKADDYGRNPVVTMYVLDADGTWNEYEFAKKVSVDVAGVDTDYETAELEALFGLETGTDYAGAHKGVVQYKLNSSGKVDTLILPKEGVTDEYLSVADIDADKEFDAEDYTIGSIEVAEDAVIFALANGEDDDEEDITVASISTIFEDGEKYVGKYYVSKDGDKEIPNAFVVNADGSTVKHTSRFFIVTDFGMNSNADEDAQYALTGYTNGSDEVVTYFVSEDNYNEDADDYEDVQEGDTIVIALDEAGEICDLKILVSAAEVEVGKEGFETAIVEKEDEGYELFGYVATSGTNKRGDLYYDLSKNAFDDCNDADDVADYLAEGRIREADIPDGSNVYYVDLSGRNNSYEVSADLSDVLAANINVETDNGGEGYFIYTKILEGDIIDVVVYIVDCDGFADLSCEEHNAD